MSTGLMRDLTVEQRKWLVRAAAFRELAPAHESELRAAADAIPDAVGPVRRGGLTTRESDRLLADWRAQQLRGVIRRFGRRG